MTTKNYGLVGSIAELERHVNRLIEENQPIGLDIETGYLGDDVEKGSLRIETNLLVGISFTNSLDWARYIPLRHDTGANLDPSQVAPLMWRMLNTGLGVAHNAPFELRNLSRWFREHLAEHPEFGPAVRASDGYFPIRSDSMVEAYLVANDDRYVPRQSFGLKQLTEVLFGHKMTELHELFADLPVNRRKYLRFNVLDPHDPKVTAYAGEDALWCLAIHREFYDKVKDRLLYKVEHGIVTCVSEMGDHGVPFDWPFLARAGGELKEFKSRFNGEIMARLSEMVGEPIAVNLASPKQIGDLLYGRLGMRTNVWTPKTKDLPVAERKMSTGRIAMTRLAEQYPVVKKILQFKEICKLLGSYLDKYENVYGYAPDGRAHPNLMGALVITGRFACSDPNYQQLPKHYHFDLREAEDVHAAHADAHGPKCDCDDPQFQPPPGTCFTFNFRDAVVAPTDHYILGFDLSQAELRAIAGEAQEQALLDAFARGDDVHTLTAALMLGIPVDEVTKEQRNIGKTFNFALLYGMREKSLADRLAITLDEAKKLYAQYFAAYPAIAAWTQRQVAFGRANGYVLSKFGRVMPIWDFRSDDIWIQHNGERQCGNFPIQSSATGDYVKLAMIRARKALRDAGLHDRVRLFMNVHDALEFSVHRSVPPQDVIKVLQPAVIFPVAGWPAMKADWHLAKRWGSPMELQVFDDGQLLVKGRKVAEIAPAVDIDEDGQAVEVLPEVDPATLRAALAQSTPDSPRQVVVTIEAMPDMQTWLAFREYVRAHPGGDPLLVRTPQGEVELDPAGIGPRDTAEISRLLGPVKINYAGSDVDAELITEGMTL